ncbi:hypothetical protein LYNGBM3L_49580 [Moorena producens 3L]|uniref:Uncharacterized protein n=1 Tax=Moorena producens 3L TaxID=489825 RepID=F4XXZ4_9CYAN|nr:hypothetical protein LYNGBM3L_49580 [Moorena producens 3L]
MALLYLLFNREQGKSGAGARGDGEMGRWGDGDEEIGRWGECRILLLIKL